MRAGPLLVLTVLVAVLGAPSDIPTSLSDDEFWRLSQEMSEANGSFLSDNLVSNEVVFARIVPELRLRMRTGGVYLGVGPEQNFTYIAAMQPRIAFITDIRRGNLQLHLMYKALFELSSDRADFVSRLFSKKRPDSLTSSSSAVEVMNAYWDVRSEPEETFQSNLKAIHDELTRRHRLPLSPEDLSGIAAVYRAFYWYGPGITYNAQISLQASPTSIATAGRGSYAWLVMQTSGIGEGLSYLGSEAGFRVVKDLESRNLIVPVVGNFAGPKALRAVGAYLRERGTTVSAFYVSNVEQYLKGNKSWPRFCANVATMPLDESSVFIRPTGLSPGTVVVPMSGKAPEGPSPFVGWGLVPIAAEVRDCSGAR